MKTILTAAVALVVLASCAHRTAPAQLEELDRTANAVREDLRIPGLSIVIARDGEVLLARGYGMSDVERQIAATPETLYPIGSITKTFTATLMLQLVERGRLDLEQPVAQYVAWQVAPDIRIRHVLSHTSEGTPGGRFAYSSRFNWLDNVVEAATKESFRKMMTEQVLAPAGLTRTLPGEEAEGYVETLQGLAQPYRVADGAVVRSKYPPMGFHSSSGLSSTVLDLARYSAALDAGQLLGGDALTRAYTPAQSTGGEPLPYGLGWFSQVVAGERVVWHTSWWPDAYSGLIVKVPSRRLTLVLLANTDALVAPQGGASNVLLYPIANKFLQAFLPGSAAESSATAIVADALTKRARGEAAQSDALLRRAVDCCLADLRSISADDRLRIFGESRDASVRAVGTAAGEQLLAAFPDDVHVRFNLALVYGRVRPELRIGGDSADRAVAMLDSLVTGSRPMPKWMDAWSSYLVAEQLVARDPARARTLAERAKATGVDTDGLQSRVAALLSQLDSR